MKTQKLIIVLILLVSLCFGVEENTFLTNKTIYFNTSTGISNHPVYIIGIQPRANLNGSGIDLGFFNEDGDRGLLLDMSYKKDGEYIGYKGVYGGVYNTNFYDKVIPIVLNTFSLGKMDRLYVSCTFYFHFTFIFHYLQE